MLELRKNSNKCKCGGALITYYTKVDTKEIFKRCNKCAKVYIVQALSGSMYSTR